jgi:hypothetical protein
MDSTTCYGNSFTLTFSSVICYKIEVVYSDYLCVLFIANGINISLDASFYIKHSEDWIGVRK